MNDDADLLRRYVEDGSEPAFTTLVHRHVNLVYAAALRRTNGDPHRAADVAQQVFVALARESRKLSRHTVLPAWLHTATRNSAITLMISEQRRQARETEAMTLAAAPAVATNPEWDRLRPLLDAAIDELPATDRAAVVLRFLERRPFAEIGAALQVSEDAARMRTDRALEKLRAALARRGITSTAEALGVIVAAQSLVAAPAGLAAALAAHAVSAGGAGLLASLMTTKIIPTVLLGVLIAFGAGTYVGLSRRSETLPPIPRPTDVNLIASLRQDNQRLAGEVAGLKADVADLSEANARLTSSLGKPSPGKIPTMGMARWEIQRTILGNLRQIDAARRQYQLEHGQAVTSLEPLVGRGHYIKAVRTVGGEDYSGLSMVEGTPLTVTALDGTTVTYDPSGATTTKPDYPPEVARYDALVPKVQPLIKGAVTAYQAAHAGKNPPNSDSLLPYFATPQDGADFVEFLELQKQVGP